MDAPALNDPIARLVAHRGHAAELPENTLPAFTSALDYGARYLECDVQLTADLCPVVLHDANLRRTAGVDRSIFSVDSRNIEHIEVAEAARFGARHCGTRLPRLTEFVALLGAHPGVTAFVELKRASLTHHGRAAVLERVYAALQPIAPRAVLISFDFEVLGIAQRQGWRVGAVLPVYDAENARELAALEPEFVFCDCDKLPSGDGPVWSGPWQWVAYEVTDAAVLQRLAGRGVALFETMAIARLALALRSP